MEEHYTKPWMFSVSEPRKRLLERVRRFLNVVEEDPRRTAPDQWGMGESREFRIVGVGRYLLDADVDAFRRMLKDSVIAAMRGFERKERTAGDDRYEQDMAYALRLWDAFACGEWEVAPEFASMFVPNFEKRVFSHPVARAMGVLAICSALGDQMMTELEATAHELVDNRKLKNWRGYGMFARGMIRSRTDEMLSAIPEIVAGHIAETERRGGMWADEPGDHLICVWGVGALNLARLRGFDVSSNNPLIPSNLLVGVQ
jgi:hypothetical protein